MQGSRTARRSTARRRSLAIGVVLGGLLAGLLLPGAAASEAASTATVSKSRATWVWTRPAPATLVDWASTHAVRELFVSVPPALGTSSALPWAKKVSTLAHAAGIRVSALGGDPGWIDQPAAALAWQRSAVATGLFDGVHVDVEPWVRDDWGSRRAEVVAGYVDLLRQLGTATTLPLEADIAFWLHTIPTADGTPLDVALMRHVDAVTVMSYRRTATGADSITDLGAHELATAAERGIPCRLAVETNDLRPDPDWRKQTFFAMSRKAMYDVLAAVDRASADDPAYAGISIEDYAGWRAMKP